MKTIKEKAPESAIRGRTEAFIRLFRIRTAVFPLYPQNGGAGVPSTLPLTGDIHFGRYRISVILRTSAHSPALRVTRYTPPVTSRPWSSAPSQVTVY